MTQLGELTLRSKLHNWKPVTVGAMLGLLVAGAFWAIHSHGTELRRATIPPGAKLQLNARAVSPTAGGPAQSAAVKSDVVEVPELPKELQGWRPATLLVSVTDRRQVDSKPQLRQVTRGRDRVHIRTLGTDHEWLFVRNPADGLSVTGTEMVHRRRTLVEYEESELRSMGIARGWADVILFGVDVSLWRDGLRLGNARKSHGLEFFERAPRQGTSEGLESSFWNDEEVVPLRIINSDLELSLINVEFFIQDSLLSEPWERFPTYARMDVSDFREKHHEHGSHGTIHGFAEDDHAPNGAQ